VSRLSRPWPRSAKSSLRHSRKGTSPCCLATVAVRPMPSISRRSLLDGSHSNRPALPVLALSVNTSAVTAIGNDYGFDLVFARQIEALGRSGDVAIGISTSGNSPNVLQGVAVAKKDGVAHGGADWSGRQ